MAAHRLQLAKATKQSCYSAELLLKWPFPGMKDDRMPVRSVRNMAETKIFDVKIYVN
jgi:hypothetical protein